MIRKFCDCGNELEYIRTFSKEIINNTIEILETCWYCKECNAEWTINIMQDVEEE